MSMGYSSDNFIGVFLAETKSIAYGDLGAKAILHVLAAVSD